MFQSFINHVISKKYLVVILFGIVATILWNTYDFSVQIEKEERLKMEILAKAYDRFGSSDLNQDFSLEAKIIESNNNIPMIVTDEKGTILMLRNIDTIGKKKDFLEKRLNVMKNEIEPLEINFLEDQKYKIYYSDSSFLKRLKYYPLLLIVILLVFAIVIYLVFYTSKIADQNLLWTGMAKETAHQLGTPLSSLVGWIDLIRLDHSPKNYLDDMQKDVDRLNIIAKRFSKIGSTPQLKEGDIAAIVKSNVNYFKRRSAKQIEIVAKGITSEAFAKIESELLSWVFENLIKNAIDALPGAGLIEISLNKIKNQWAIDVKDNGKGMTKKVQRNIFKPGFTTKKRGWGLGLSLSKRIVEDYHNGKLMILKSDPNGGGTTIRVLINI